MERGKPGAAAACALLAALAAGCRPAPDPAATAGSPDPRPALSILLLDATPAAHAPRADDAREPAPVLQWLMGEIDRLAADLAIVQGVPAAEQALQPGSALRLRWPERTLAAMTSEGAPSGMIAVSRDPFTVNRRHASSYRIGDQVIDAGYGVLDITTASPGWPGIRIVSFNLKDKVFHRSGQTEMRRNEARLVAGILRDILEQAPRTPLLVLGNLQDDPQSAAYRLVASPATGSLVDLRPTDDRGDAWTAWLPEPDHYARTALALATPSLAPRIDRAATRIEPATVNESFRNRPLHIVLHEPGSARK